MKRLGVIIAVFTLMAAPVLADISENLQILNRYCFPKNRNFLSPVEAFSPICSVYQPSEPVDCCNYVAQLVQRYASFHLCANNGVYNLEREPCLVDVSNRNSAFEEPATDSKIYFPTQNPFTTVRELFAAALNVPSNPSSQSYRPFQQSSPQYTAVPSAQQVQNPLPGNTKPSAQLPIRASANKNSASQRPQPNQVRPPAIPAANWGQQIQNQPVESNPAPYDAGDYEEDKPVVLYNTAGYQAMDFALSLFKSLNGRGDSVISPLLPQQLLSNLIDVAKPKAADEIQRAIRLHPERLAGLTKSLDKVSKSTVNTIETAAANFVAKNSNLNKTYQNALKLRNVEIIPVDFTKPDQAARQANNWVSSKTHRFINEILNAGSINPYTRMLLANSIYFKGKWKYSFIKTEPGQFESAPGRSLPVNSMFQLNKLRYGEVNFPDGNGLRWVELPYDGESMSMLVFLPQKRHQLQASLQQLQPQQLAQVMAQLQVSYVDTKVNLHMPRFTLTDSVSLIPALQQLGIRSIFTESNALPYLASEPTLVSDVTQRSYLSVDEFGTKATSVASLSIVTLSITPQFRTVQFDVNEPFLVMIVDKQERYPIFIGQVYEPQE